MKCTTTDSTLDAVMKANYCAGGRESMFSINLMSRTPVYEQIIDQLGTFVLKGVLKAGDQVPSVRSLSIQLSINPNTIQKAYSELDRMGIICTVPGRGSFVAESAALNLRNLKRTQLNELKEIVEVLVLAGISRDEIVSSVDEVFEKSRGEEKYHESDITKK